MQASSPPEESSLLARFFNLRVRERLAHELFDIAEALGLGGNELVNIERCQLLHFIDLSLMVNHLFRHLTNLVKWDLLECFNGLFSVLNRFFDNCSYVVKVFLDTHFNVDDSVVLACVLNRLAQQVFHGRDFVLHGYMVSLDQLLDSRKMYLPDRTDRFA